MRKIILAGLLGISIGIGTAAAAEVVVNIAPPRAVVEHRPHAPGPHYAWIGGYHRWDGRAYVWVSGRWERPPREHAVWVAPRWHHRGGHWVFVEGRWRG
jgi:hypothetical protein